MHKILKIFSMIIISLFFLSIFGWMVFHIVKGDKKYGILEGPITFLYTFPDLFKQSVEEVKSLPQTFIPTPECFHEINNLDFDLNVLITYPDTGKTQVIELKNLRNNKLNYKWRVENPLKAHNRILNPLLLADKNIIYFFSGATGLRRIDSLGNYIWKQDSMHAHHSMELDSKGNIWVCTFEPVYYANGLYHLNGRSVFFKDNYITSIDPETGQVLFNKSVTKILIDNKLEHYILKSDEIKDPLHINDIQPALKTTNFYQENDLFISARNTSFILHYRPRTNKVINVLEGPFSSQHDVDFLNDESLLIFNNNYYTVWSQDSKNAPMDSSRLTFAGDFYSNILRYDFDNMQWSTIGDSIFRANSIFTHTEGLLENIDKNTYFIEEQNTGLLWVIRDNELLYKSVLTSQHKGYHKLPNWTRIIKNYD